MIHHFKKSRFSYKHILLFMILGAIAVSLFATVQFFVILGTTAEPKMYIVPTVLGIVAGLLLSIWVQRLSFAEKALKENNDRLKFVLEGVGIGLWEWYPQTNEVEYDTRWCEMLGYKLNEVERSLTSWESRVHPEDIKQCYIDIQSHIDGETEFYSNIHRMKHKNGHWVYILDKGKIVKRDAEGNPTLFSGTHTDISHLKKVEHELEESNQKLNHIALIDGLTEIGNRRALDEHLTQQWELLKRNEHPFSVLMLDIDFFKEFNDTYGHLHGDDALKQVAGILREKATNINDIAVR